MCDWITWITASQIGDPGEMLMISMVDHLDHPDHPFFAIPGKKSGRSADGGMAASAAVSRASLYFLGDPGDPNKIGY